MNIKKIFLIIFLFSIVKSHSAEKQFAKMKESFDLQLKKLLQEFTDIASRKYTIETNNETEKMYDILQENINNEESTVEIIELYINKLNLLEIDKEKNQELFSTVDKELKHYSEYLTTLRKRIKLLKEKQEQCPKPKHNTNGDDEFHDSGACNIS